MHSNYRLRFCEPVIPNMGQVERYLAKSKSAGQLSNFGPLYRELQDRLIDYFRLTPDRSLVLCSSGHVALMAAYSVLNVQDLLIPAYTFESTRAAATLCHTATIVQDISATTGSLDLDQTRAMLESGQARSVCLVTPLSSVPNLQLYHDLCRSYSTPLVIDAAASFGTKIMRSYGDMQCISFHATKSFPIGEGGAIIAGTEHIEALESYINFGLDSERCPVRFGLNGKLSEYSCAIGLALLDIIDTYIYRRLENAAWYRQFLPLRTLLSTTADEIVYQCYPVFLSSADNARKARQALLGAGYEVGAYYRPLVSLSIADQLYATNTCLPVHSQVTKADIQNMANIIMQAEEL